MNVSLPPSKPDNLLQYVLDPLSVIVKLAILNKKPAGTKLVVFNNTLYYQEPGSFQSICRFVVHATKTDLAYLNNPIYYACQQFLVPHYVDRFADLPVLFSEAQRGLNKLADTYRHNDIIHIVLHYYSEIIASFLALVQAHKSRQQPTQSASMQQMQHIKNKKTNPSASMSADESATDSMGSATQPSVQSATNNNQSAPIQSQPGIINSHPGIIRPLIDNISPLYTQNLTTKFNEHWTDKNITLILSIVQFLVADTDALHNVQALETVMTSIDKTVCQIISSTPLL